MRLILNTSPSPAVLALQTSQDELEWFSFWLRIVKLFVLAGFWTSTRLQGRCVPVLSVLCLYTASSSQINAFLSPGSRLVEQAFVLGTLFEQSYQLVLHVFC